MMRSRATREAGAAGAAIVGAGSALGATAASACCVGPVISPLLVSLLGASGAAWAASLKPYSLYLLGGAFLFLLYGFRSAYRRPVPCALGEARTSSLTRTASPVWLRIVLWCSAALWIAALIINLVVGGSS